jgi:hypothetical protein
VTKGSREQGRGIGQMGPRASPPASSLRGRWLLLARVAWVAVTITALAIVVFSAPITFEQFRTVCTASAEVCSTQRAVEQLTPAGVQALQEVDLSLRFYAAVNVAIATVFQLVWLAAGALIFWNRSDDRMALLVSLFLVAFGTATFDPAGVDILISTHWAWWLPARGLQVLGEVCAVLFFLLFPGGRFVPRWTRWIGVVFLAFQIPSDLFPDVYSRSPALESLQDGVFVGFLVSIVWSQIYRYRGVSTPVQRLQTKWVVFGTTLAIAGLFVVVLPFFLFLSWPGGDKPFILLAINTGLTLSMLLIPLSIGVAVLRSRLFDIDLVINRTLVYGPLTAMLVFVYIGGVVSLQYAFRALTGQESQLAVVASTLAIAALFNPVRGQVQAFVDRRFYRRKYDAARTLANFSAKLRDETDLDALNDELVSVVRETMQPAHVSLWLRPDPQPSGSEGRKQVS